MSPPALWRPPLGKPWNVAEASRRETHEAAAAAASFWRLTDGSVPSSRRPSHLTDVGLSAELDAIFYDESSFDKGDAGWRYLPSRAQAKAKRAAHTHLLRTGRHPRKILLTEKEWTELKAAQLQLAADLRRCRPGDRCGSMACLPCRRAWVQRQRKTMETFFMSSPGDPTWRQHHLTVIPFGMQFLEGSLDRFDPFAANCRLQQILTSIEAPWVAVGVLEISYEEVVGSWSYWQPHWHLLTTGPDVPAIAEELRGKLPFFNPNNPSVVRREVYDLRGATRYDSKPAEKGWRWVADAKDSAARRVIPATRQRELLLWLHRWSPWSMLVFVHAELTSSAGVVQIRSILPEEGNVFS